MHLLPFLSPCNSSSPPSDPTIQPTNQPINQSTNQPTNQPNRDIVLCLDAVRDASNRDLLVSGSKDCEVRAWCGATGACLGIAAGHVSAVTAVALGRKGKGQVMVTAGADKLVKVWDLGALVGAAADWGEIAGGCCHFVWGAVGGRERGWGRGVAYVPFWWCRQLYQSLLLSVNPPTSQPPPSTKQSPTHPHNPHNSLRPPGPAHPLSRRSARQGDQCSGSGAQRRPRRYCQPGQDNQGVAAAASGGGADAEGA